MEVVFKQIAGLIARRIVFNLREGDRVERGQRVGLIKFGSRTDIILPAEAEICVRTGERVKGGSSVLAQMVGAEMPESEFAVGTTTPRRAERASAQPETPGGAIA
jgi:phosphatidylserine decarboxylase